MWSFFKFLDKIKKKIVGSDEIQLSGVFELSVMCVSLEKKELFLVLDLEDLVEVLRGYVNLVVNTIHEFKGIIIRYIANDVLVIFRDKEHQKSVCEATIEIIKRFKKWRETSSVAEKIPCLNIAIGVNTGEAIIVKGKNFYDVWGESVIIAMRLQKECLNCEKENLISDSTYQLVKDIIYAEDIGELVINNKKIKTWNLLTNKNKE